MLTIQYQGRNDNKHFELQWCVGRTVPYVDPQLITQILATGEEKDYIDELMGMAFDRPTVRFYGDIARTVYLNLDQ